MLKYGLFSLIASLFVLSILAPSVEALYRSDYDTAYLMDVNEEEQSNQENEGESELKQWFYNSPVTNRKLYLALEGIENRIYLFVNLDFSSEVILPPPKT